MTQHFPEFFFFLCFEFGEIFSTLALFYVYDNLPTL